MKIVFRVDASTFMGSGHVMRCLILAEALREKKHHIYFICRDYPGNFIDIIKARKFSVAVLPFEEHAEYQAQQISDNYAHWLWVSREEDAIQTISFLKNKNIDLIIVDHYGLDEIWEKLLRPFVKRMMVIDDLANRSHDCDVLLDQNYYQSLENRYCHLAPKDCHALLGPKYAMIRPEFFNIKAERSRLGKSEPHPIKNIIVYMGSSDLKNYTEKVLLSLLLQPKINTFHVDVVMGILNPHKEKIQEICLNHAFSYHCQPDYYHDLLGQADIAIMAGGVSTYERCFILLPSIVYAIADNQRQLVKDIAAYGAHYACEGFDVQALSQGFVNIEKGFSTCLTKMASLVDGKGVGRILQVIENE